MAQRMFENRRSAAEELATNLEFLQTDQPVVLGILNGGLILAEVVAQQLNAPLDVIIIEKLFPPSGAGHAVGVVDEHGRISMIQSTARWHHLTSRQMVEPAREAFEDIQKRRARVRELLPEVEVRNRTVVLVDEGIDAGARMLGAIASVRDRGASKVVVAAPAGASRATWQLRDKADVVVIPHRPNKFKGIEKFYKHFPPVSDETVLAIIERNITERPEQQQPGIRTIHQALTNSAGLELSCELDLPAESGADSAPAPAVLFAHGFDSNAVNPRNVPISRRLAKRGIIGVRLDFTGHGRSEGDIEQATDEQMLDDLKCVLAKIASLAEVDHQRLGLVGSGTGGLIALQLAAHEPMLGALVLRGPMLGDERELASLVGTPTLIIHAEEDTALAEGVDVLEEHLRIAHQCLRVPDSNRLFNDPISMELMINATIEWLADHLKHVHTGPAPTIEMAQSAPGSEDDAPQDSDRITDPE